MIVHASNSNQELSIFIHFTPLYIISEFVINKCTHFFLITSRYFFQVIGFDLFHTQPELSGNDDAQMTNLFTDSNFKGIDPKELEESAKEITGREDRIELVVGDVTKTCKEVSSHEFHSLSKKKRKSNITQSNPIQSNPIQDKTDKT